MAAKGQYSVLYLLHGIGGDDIGRRRTLPSDGQGDRDPSRG
jgi:hypothetical protein